ncbi:MAG: UPF0146 family protein [Haloferacaceae archaeon]
MRGVESTADAMIERLAGRDSAVEVGVGARPAVAAGLADAGVDVTAVDVTTIEVPAGVRFVRDDVVERAAVVERDPGPYRDADVVYARRLPPELHRPTLTVARAVGADLVFTTLGGDPALVPVDPEAVPGGTLLRARRGPGPGTGPGDGPIRRD